MNPPPVMRCAVCREPRAVPEGWFQLVENRWTDRLRILRFQDALASQPTAYSACCPAHVRELVVHWMTIGRLDIPFAQVPSGTRRIQAERSEPGESTRPESPFSSSSLLGELAVHRESLTRILRENPEALSPVLETLIQALESDPCQRTHEASGVAGVAVGEPVAV
jgi:hypothetical protein